MALKAGSALADRRALSELSSELVASKPCAETGCRRGRATCQRRRAMAVATPTPRSKPVQRRPAVPRRQFWCARSPRVSYVRYARCLHVGKTYTALLNSERHGKPQRVVCKVAKQRAGHDEWQEFRILVSSRRVCVRYKRRRRVGTIHHTAVTQESIPPHEHVLALRGLCANWDGNPAIVVEYHPGGGLQQLCEARISARAVTNFAPKATRDGWWLESPLLFVFEEPLEEDTLFKYAAGMAHGKLPSLTRESGETDRTINTRVTSYTAVAHLHANNVVHRDIALRKNSTFPCDRSIYWQLRNVEMETDVADL